MTSEELSTYEAESYPPPCVDPSFFEGPYGPRHGWAMIPQSLYKTEKNDACVNQLMRRKYCRARWICLFNYQKTTKKLVAFLQIRKVPKMLMIHDHFVIAVSETFDELMIFQQLPHTVVCMYKRRGCTSMSTVGSSGDGRASVWGVSALEMALLKDWLWSECTW